MARAASALHVLKPHGFKHGGLRADDLRQAVSGQAALSIPAVSIAAPAGQRRSCSAVGHPGSGLTGLLPLALTGAR
jgi:hypothetical protein